MKTTMSRTSNHHFGLMAFAALLFAAVTLFGGARTALGNDICIEPPVITCPADVVAECTGGLTPVTYDPPSVTSLCEPVAVVCDPSFGSGFPQGQTVVNCTATDLYGSTASCSFTVTVVDTTPPQVTCPANITTNATPGQCDATVTYIASATDPCGLQSFDCSPPSGSTFPGGTTTGTCTAVDVAGLTSSCSFDVTVDTFSPEVCNDGQDNDCDGLIDAADPDCPTNCDDNNACTIDTFDPSSGQCLNTPKNCDDGLFCNGIESCEPTTGNCVAVSACPPSIDGCVIRGATCDEVNDICVDFADDSLCDDGNPNTTDSCDPATGQCVNKEDKACWLTAGGVKFEPLIGKRMATANKGSSGPVISIGGNVNPACSPTAGDGGNWTHIDHKAKLFFQGRHIEVVDCGTIPGLPPGSTSPDTPFNYIEFKGTGTLKGIAGNKADYGTVNFYVRVEDRSEPGSKETLDPFIDQYWIRITDAVGNELYRLGNDVPNPEAGDTIPISGGNMQIHESSCDSYN